MADVVQKYSTLSFREQSIDLFRLKAAFKAA